MKLFKIAALSMIVASPLAAQTAEEPYVHLFSDQGITARLTESGYTDIGIARDGMKLMIDATKDGSAHHLVYDMTTGALIEVDGAGYTMGTPPGIPGKTESEAEAD